LIVRKIVVVTTITIVKTIALVTKAKIPTTIIIKAQTQPQTAKWNNKLINY